MIIYILKFSACVALFLVFYKLVLEKENMHVFKRFYLLGTLLLSIGIPLITFTYYVEPSGEIFQQITQNIPLQKSAILLEPDIDYLPIILWSIYGLGVFLFGVNFLRNLYDLNYKIKHNPKQKSNRITNVLLKDLVIPHTFFNYIFLNKRKFETHQIPKEVFWHEETHAIQKHSIDVLFIEILQIVFWFNPLIYFIKYVVKLNHEFLADQAVLKKGVETATYQETLLAFSSNAMHPQLANAINYSSIKKRFTVMKTQTTKKAIWLRSLILLPLLAIILYGFSARQIIEKNIVSKTSITNHTARSVDIEVFNNGTYKIDDIKATKETFISVINQLHQDITPEIRNQIINVHVNSGKTVSDEEVWFIYNSFIDYGFHRIVTYNQEIIREKGNKPFATTNTGKQEHSKDIIEQQKATKEQVAEYNKLAKKYNSMSKDNMVIKRSDLERIKYLYDLMSVEQRKKAQPFPSFPAPPPPVPDAPEAPKANFPPPPPLPKNATPEQINTYKRAYRDAQVADKILRSKAEKEELVKVREISSVQDRERLKQENLKIKRQKEQLAKMQEIIDQESIASPQEKERIKKITQAYAKKHPEKVTKTKLPSGEVIDIIEMPIDDEGIVDIYDKSYKYIIKDGEMTYYDKNGKTLTEEDINKLPPPPNWPLKHVTEMAKKNATFFIDGEKISVGTEGINSKYPRVYLYTKNQ